MIKSKKNTSAEPEENKDSANSDSVSPEESSKSVNDSSNSSLSNNSKTEESPDINKGEAELKEKIKEIELLTDTMKRRQADFENYKKRMIKTQEEQRKFAIKDLALDIININDDLIRAYDAACNISREKTIEEICSTFSEGFFMISKRIEDALKKYGIKEIDSLNKPFDPTFNEAVEIDESDTVDTDTITKVHQKGFRLDDFLVRSAKVKVTRPKKNLNNDNNESEPKNPNVESNSD